MNNLQPLKWTKNNGMGVVTHTSESPLHSYIIRYDELERTYLIDYFERMTGEHGSEFFKSVDEAKSWAQSTHYKDKMQPYVKPSPTWVDVNERLPEKNGGYLAVCKEYEGNEVFLACWHGDGWTGNECIDDAYQYYDSVTVTHWMPIPEFSTMQNLHKGGDCE